MAEEIDFNEIDRRIVEAKQGGLPPAPQWRKNYPTDWKNKITVNDVPEAKGNFTW